MFFLGECSQGLSTSALSQLIHSPTARPRPGMAAADRENSLYKSDTPLNIQTGVPWLLAGQGDKNNGGENNEY